MKNILFLLFYFPAFSLYAQNQAVEFDGKKWEAPYTLNCPKDWDVERFLIPISFAPEIPYKGIEDIRFTPGWGKANSDEYWSYAFLWYLEGTPKTNAKIVKSNLTTYYTGLIASNQGDIPTRKKVSVNTEIRKIKTETGDLKTFSGTIYLLDYMAQKPITLYCVVHVKSCSRQNKTYIFHEISPRLFGDKVWEGLHQLWTEFSCDKALKSK